MSLYDTPMQEKPLTSRVLKTELVSWKDLQFIQQDDFKDLPSEAKEKLKNSIIVNNFTQPFYVWQDQTDSVMYCLDGKHRTLMLEELIRENYHVPDLLPATFIECKDKKEAAKLVLIYSSVYAKITEEGFTDFMDLYNLDPEEMKLSIDLPGFNESPTEKMQTDPFNDEGILTKDQYGVIVICDNAEAQEKVFTSLSEEGYKCKVVVT